MLLQNKHCKLPTILCQMNDSGHQNSVLQNMRGKNPHYVAVVFNNISILKFYPFFIFIFFKNLIPYSYMVLPLKIASKLQSLSSGYMCMSLYLRF